KPLDETVFDQVLGPRPKVMRQGLVRMAMAVDLAEARMGPIVAEEPLPVARRVQNFLAGDLWGLWQAESDVAGCPRDPPSAPAGHRASARPARRDPGNRPGLEDGTRATAGRRGRPRRSDGRAVPRARARPRWSGCPAAHPAV